MQIINIISGLIMGAVLAIVAMQWLENNVHPMAYWAAANGEIFWTLADCMARNFECSRAIGFFLE